MPTLVINELMAQNTNSVQDSHGDYDDWIELYNCGNSAIDVAGCCLTDDLTEPTQWRIPATPSWNSRADSSGESDGQDFDVYVDISLFMDTLKPGASVLAIHGMNSGPTSSDFLISVAMDAVSVKVEGEVAYQDDLKLRNDLRITELMYHAPQGGDGDYIELRNIGGEVLDVNGVRLSRGVDLVFPAMTSLSCSRPVAILPLHGCLLPDTSCCLPNGWPFRLAGARPSSCLPRD